MVTVFKVVSFLELGQGNIIILRKIKNICIPGAFLEETKQTEALFLLSFVQALWRFINVLDISQKSQALLVSQAIAFTHSSKIRLSLVTWSYCNMEKKKKKSLSHSIYETCTAWNINQSLGRCLHVLGVSGPCSLLLSPSLSTAAPELRLGSIFPSALLL